MGTAAFHRTSVPYFLVCSISFRKDLSCGDIDVWQEGLLERSLEMDKILEMGNKRFLLILLLAAVSFSAAAQKFTYKWQRVPMDSTWDSPKPNKLDRIVSKYHPGIESLMEIAGYTSEEMSKANPESGLSNFAADALLYAASPFLKEGDIALSLTNFGGIRADFPKGSVRIYDIYSVFPFDNTIVIVDIKGDDLRKIMDHFASEERFEALGGVRVETKDKKLVKCEINGKPLDDSKVYRLVTLDFLMDGGDRMNLRDNALNIERTKYFVRDGVIEYMKKKSAEGVVFNNKKDGRVIIK